MTVQWIPSQGGLKGNQIADSEANNPLAEKKTPLLYARKSINAKKKILPGRKNGTTFHRSG